MFGGFNLKNPYNYLLKDADFDYENGFYTMNNTLDTSYPLHIHNYIEFEYVESGTFLSEVNGEPIKLTKGSFVGLSKGDTHRDTMNSTVEIHNIILKYSDVAPEVKNILNKAKFPMYGVLDEEKLEELDRYFNLLNKAREEKLPFWTEICNSCLVLIIALFISNTVDITSGKKDKRFYMIEAAINTMIEKLAEPLTLEMIADEVHLAPTYFSKMFSKFVGTGFNEYLTFLRLDMAKKLLRKTEMSVIDVAFESGFGSYPNFSRVFKKSFGMTPRDYRNSLRK